MSTKSNGAPAGGRIVTRQGDGAGYLFNDNRAAHEGVEEADIVCCPHCQCTINLQAWRKDNSKGGTHNEMGGWCRKCFAPVCKLCTKRMLTFGCEPFIQKVNEAVERNERIRQNMKAF